MDILRETDRQAECCKGRNIWTYLERLTDRHLFF